MGADALAAINGLEAPAGNAREGLTALLTVEHAKRQLGEATRNVPLTQTPILARCLYLRQNPKRHQQVPRGRTRTPRRRQLP